MAKLSDARALALQVGMMARERDAFAAELLDARLDSTRMNESDRAFARVLVLGVARMQGSLDAVIDRCLRSPSDVKPDVRDALRISTYEIVYLRKEGHAAVSQGVELVRSIAPRAAGLANATLRKVADCSRRFPFGNPGRSDEALALLEGFPLWLTRLLIASLGGEKAAHFMHVSNQPAPVFLAVNEAKTGDASVTHTLGLDAKPYALSIPNATGAQAGSATFSVPGCHLVKEASLVATKRARTLFSQGEILVADASSQAVAACALPAEKPQHFLEIGSGRGTKTILLQSHAIRRYGSQMRLTALDSHGFKAQILTDRARTYGIDIEDCLSADARDLSSAVGDEAFDAVFIDAPCSGLGTLRRHPEIKWRLTEEQIAECAKTGLEMLREASKHVSAGGRLTYATCTVLPQENDQVVAAFLKSDEGKPFTCINVLRTDLKEGENDAHFAVVMQKSE